MELCKKSQLNQSESERVRMDIHVCLQRKIEEFVGKLYVMHVKYDTYIQSLLGNQLKNLINNTHKTGDEYLEQVGCLSHPYQRENSWLCTWLYLCVTADEYLLYDPHEWVGFPYQMEVFIDSTWRYKSSKQSCVYMNVASSIAAKHR